MNNNAVIGVTNSSNSNLLFCGSLNVITNTTLGRKNTTSSTNIYGPNSTDTISGALVVTGGVGISQDTYIGGLTRLTNTTPSTTTGTGALTVSGGVGIGGALNVGGNTSLTGTLGVSGATSLNNTLSVSGITSITNTTGSTTTGTGALTVSGGVGIGGALNVGANCLINSLRLGRGAGNISSNTVFGSEAFENNSSGTSNVAIGFRTLRANTTASNNTAVGWEALRSVTTGSNNTAYGTNALPVLTTSNNNVACGRDTLQNTNTGNDNTAIGARAGLTNTTGSRNTYLGHNADANANNFSNSTALGFGSIITESNQIVLGTSSERVTIPSTTLSTNTTTGALTVSGGVGIGGALNVGGNTILGTGGNVGIGTTTPTIPLDVIGTSRLTGWMYSQSTPGVWAINAVGSVGDSSDYRGVIPLLRSCSNCGNLYRTNGYTLVAQDTNFTVAGTLNTVDFNDDMDFVIIMPGYGIVAFENFDFAGTRILNVFNNRNNAICVQPTTGNSMSSYRLFYNNVEISEN